MSNASTGRTPVAEGGVSLRNLLDLGAVVHRHLLARPVTRQAFQKVIALDVAIVVRARHVRRVQIDEIHIRGTSLQRIGLPRAVPVPVREDRGVEDLDLLLEVLLDGQGEIPATIVVPGQVSADREHPTRLTLQASADQRRARQRFRVFVRQSLDVPGHSVDEAKILDAKEDVLEGALDEPGSSRASRHEQRVQIGTPDASVAVRDRRRCQHGRKLRKSLATTLRPMDLRR